MKLARISSNTKKWKDHFLNCILYKNHKLTVLH